MLDVSLCEQHRSPHGGGGGASPRDHEDVPHPRHRRGCEAPVVPGGGGIGKPPGRQGLLKKPRLRLTPETGSRRDGKGGCTRHEDKIAAVAAQIPVIDPS